MGCVRGALIDELLLGSLVRTTGKPWGAGGGMHMPSTCLGWASGYMHYEWCKGKRTYDHPIRGGGERERSEKVEESIITDICNYCISCRFTHFKAVCSLHINDPCRGLISAYSRFTGFCQPSSSSPPPRTECHICARIHDAECAPRFVRYWS